MMCLFLWDIQWCTKSEYKRLPLSFYIMFIFYILPIFLKYILKSFCATGVAMAPHVMDPKAPAVCSGVWPGLGM